MKYKRFAVYYAPRDGAFARYAAAWLGWDAAAGCPVAHPDADVGGQGLARLTAAPRKYGFHGTIRAPFRPAEGLAPEVVNDTVAQLAARLAPVRFDGLRLETIHGFLALTPEGCEAALLDLGAEVVAGTNALRAPLTAEERARRRPERLTPRQRSLLDAWGYPGVMEEFRFHLTLTDRLHPADALQIITAAQQYFAPVLPRPFVIEDLCLFGEDADGRFHLLHRHALTG